MKRTQLCFSRNEDWEHMTQGKAINLLNSKKSDAWKSNCLTNYSVGDEFLQVSWDCELTIF